MNRLMAWTRRWWVWIGVRLLGFGLVIGPWPTDRSGHRDSLAYRASVSRVESFPGKVVREAVRVGVAEVDLSPAMPVPLAGFIGQIATPFVGVNSRCAGKAVTIANRRSSVTLLAADLLLIDARLSRAILTRTGLEPDQIYFTATHTHSGPGGWGNHPLERLVAGTFEPAVFDRLADRLAAVVLASRAHLEPAEVAFAQCSVPGLQWNRIMAGEATNDLLSAWIFRASGPNRGGTVLATFASFGAHATIAHPVPPRLGGDYPEAFARALTRLVGAGVVLFAAGTVGDASPIRPKTGNEQQRAEAYGTALAQALAPSFATARFEPTVSLGNCRLDVDLPPVQILCGGTALRFSPWSTGWVGRRTTHLHAVRLGPAVLVGFPGDYAGHLLPQLGSTIPVVATSFNGDYKGYLVARAAFESYPCYETRQMSFFGPNLGDLLTDLAARVVARIGGTESPRDEANPGDHRL